MVAAPQRWALMTELRGEPPALERLLAQLAPCDLVLVEGFRTEGSIPRIEVRGSQASFAKATEAASASAAAAGEAVAEAIAIVCDDPIDSALPRFARDDVAAIAAFIVRQLGIDR
jgi:molybdopterin-guanine dinucleotide biosynthesis protein B